jgi:chromosome segregation ATPase
MTRRPNIIAERATLIVNRASDLISEISHSESKVIIREDSIEEINEALKTFDKQTEEGRKKIEDLKELKQKYELELKEAKTELKRLVKYWNYLQTQSYLTWRKEISK